MKNNTILPIYLFAACLLLPGSLFSQPKTDWVIEGLKGRVKSEKIYGYLQSMSTYNPAFNSGNLGYYLKTDFNEKGFKTQSVKSDKKGRLIERFTYTYDDSGYCRKSFHYNNQDSLEYYFNLFYDKKGNVTRTDCYTTSDSLVSRSINGYDSLGQLINWVYYFPLGKKQYQKTLTYDNGQPESSILVLASQSFPLKFRFEYGDYDAAGNWLKQTIYAVFNTEFMEYVYREIEYYK